MKRYIDELITSNDKKRGELEVLKHKLEDLEQHNMDQSQFNETLSRWVSKSKLEDTYLDVGFNPNRTTSNVFGVQESRKLEALCEKLGELKDQLLNIELLIEKEKETSNSVNAMYAQLKKDTVSFCMNYIE